MTVDHLVRGSKGGLVSCFPVVNCSVIFYNLRIDYSPGTYGHMLKVKVVDSKLVF